MARKYSELRAKLPRKIQDRAERQARVLLADMALPQLRASRGVTQEELARRLGLRQSNVSAMERRLDVHVSTLCDLVEALGGKLELIARFPDGDVRIDQFEGVTRRALGQHPELPAADQA
ncbi:MAG: XRE family transcriptional regulator [Gemmatimonadetes bacterium]|nr:XRE family transcriptional regulator [Gemmatimonadota bacterium]